MHKTVICPKPKVLSILTNAKQYVLHTATASRMSPCSKSDMLPRATITHTRLYYNQTQTQLYYNQTHTQLSVKGFAVHTVLCCPWYISLTYEDNEPTQFCVVPNMSAWRMRTWNPQFCVVPNMSAWCMRTMKLYLHRGSISKIISIPKKKYIKKMKKTHCLQECLLTKRTQQQNIKSVYPNISNVSVFSC